MLGYGSQGHAHALNLADSGIEVEVGLRDGQRVRAAAEEAGLRGRDRRRRRQGRAARRVPGARRRQPQLFERRSLPNLAPGAALLFAHGFNIHYGRIAPPAGHDVIMVAPKGPGHVVRRIYKEGFGTPAVDRRRAGRDRARRASWRSPTAVGIGSARAGMLETTFAEETESDLFGEQAVLCGGVTQLIHRGFETLVEAGYQPEIAYYECLHELKLIVDLICEGGIERMHYSISDTAEYGAARGGPKVVDEHVRENMRKVLGEIQDGTFAREWIAEMDVGEANLEAYRRSCADDADRRSGTRAAGAARREEVAEAHGVD